MYAIRDYFEPNRPSYDYVRELSDVQEHPAPSPKTSALILSLVQRYAIEYHLLRLNNHHRHVPHGALPVPHPAVPVPERLAVSCLQDVPSTAALVQEIAFTPAPLNADGSHEFADLGAGTGILSVASIIAAARSGASAIVGHCVEYAPSLLVKMELLLKAAAPHVSIHATRDNVTHPSLYSDLPSAKIRSWVSETINTTPLHLDVTPDDVSWHGTLGEPFPAVMRNLVRNVPGFYASVQSGQTTLFPDPIHDRYRPHLPAEALQLRTSNSHATHGPLHEVGADFKDYQTVVAGRRWGAHPW